MNDNTNEITITTEGLADLADVEAFLTENGDLIELICVARSNASRETVLEALSNIARNYCDAYDRYAREHPDDVAERLAEQKVKRWYQRGGPEKRRLVVAAFSRPPETHEAASPER